MQIPQLLVVAMSCVAIVAMPLEKRQADTDLSWWAASDAEPVEKRQADTDLSWWAASDAEPVEKRQADTDLSWWADSDAEPVEKRQPDNSLEAVRTRWLWPRHPHKEAEEAEQKKM